MARTTTRKRRPVIPELMGFAEVCETLGVRTGNLQFISDLPRPVASVRATQLWLADEILDVTGVMARKELNVTGDSGGRDSRQRERTDPQHPPLRHIPAPATIRDTRTTPGQA